MQENIKHKEISYFAPRILGLLYAATNYMDSPFEKKSLI